MKRSKRFEEAAKKIDKNKIYSLDEGLKLVKETSSTKFDSSVEAHIRTGIDISKSDQQVRGSVTLPHGTGKTKIIAAFVSAGKEKEAKEAGADLILGESDIGKIKSSGKIEFDVAVTSPDMMPKLAVIAKVLGPRGLMPSPKNETITTNLAKTIEAMKKGRVNFKNDDTGNIHQIIGKTSFTQQQLKENFQALVEALKKAKPSSAKGIYLKSATICSTMGPSVKTEI